MFPDHIELAYSNFTRSYGLPGGGAGSLIPLCQCNGISCGNPLERIVAFAST
jgi:hypothetical protein